MRFLHHFAPWHCRLRSSIFSERLTLLARTLLALGFVAPGVTKVLGHPFALGLGVDNPIGEYFIVLLNTGLYYRFLGLGQIVPALLLLWRRTALLGALLFLPVIANIVVLTRGIDFGPGTQTITLGMMLANLWLVVWDAHRVAPILGPGVKSWNPGDREPANHDLLSPPSEWKVTARRLTRTGWWLGSSGLMGLLVKLRGGLEIISTPVALGLIGGAIVVTLTGWGWALFESSKPGRPAQ